MKTAQRGSELQVSYELMATLLEWRIAEGACQVVVKDLQDLRFNHHLKLCAVKGWCDCRCDCQHACSWESSEEERVGDSHLPGFQHTL